jgi:hypothetical protein
VPGLPGPEEEPQLGPRLFRISCLGMDELHRLVVHPRRNATSSEEVADEGVKGGGIADVDSHHSSRLSGRARSERATQKHEVARPKSREGLDQDADGSLGRAAVADETDGEMQVDLDTLGERRRGISVIAGIEEPFEPPAQNFRGVALVQLARK